jgi:1-acyl-sn-glycerol-3-phosphate acyltransferase
MAKIELFRGPFGWIAPFWGAFPVRRFEADVAALLAAERHLHRGHVIGMFPEGTRSRSHVFQQPHPGTAVIALHTGATILPCAITGTERIHGRFGLFPWLFQRIPITATIGPPIAVTAVRRPSEEQVSELTSRIYGSIRALLPPAYAGSYTGSEGTDESGNGEDPPRE